MNLPPTRKDDALTSTTLPDADGGIDAIAQLAQDAASTYRDRTIGLAEPVIGLPETVTVLFRDGKTPEVKGLKDLFEAYRTAPERRDGTAAVTVLQSFIDLVNRHKDPGSAIFAETVWPSPKLTAVIDYHTLDRAARFSRHRVVYGFPVSDELNEWVKGNGEPMSQGDFAAFIENRIADLASPNDAEAIEFERKFKTKFAVPNEMVDLSRGLAVQVGAEVKNAVTLQSGEMEVVFKEEHRNAAGEKITVPGLFMVQVPAFRDGDPVRLVARLRYRLRSGALTWAYQLYQWEEEVRARVSEDLARAAAETSLPAYEGAPEMSAR